MVPNEQNDRADELGRYLIDEGLVEIAGAKKWLQLLYKNGSVIAVWIDAETRQEALENYWSFWNHGATSAEDLHWTSSTEVISGATRRKAETLFQKLIPHRRSIKRIG